MSPKQFESSKFGMTDSQVCRVVPDMHKSPDVSFATSVSAELDRRGLTSAGCADMVAKENQRAALVLGAILLGAAAVAVARSGGSGGSTYAPASYNTDTTWAWDQFRDQFGSLIWACRGRQTGQFADQWRCAGQFQSDYTWPGP